MKKKTVLLFIFDGFADWEMGYVMPGIRMSETYSIKTIAITRNPVRSMGDVVVLPDLDFIPQVDLADIDASNTAMLLLPGGTPWEQQGNRDIGPLILHCVEKGIPVAAICGATILLADLGLLDDIDHTSNDLAYLETLSPGYQGGVNYQFSPVVSSLPVITASGTAAIDFASVVFETLDIANHDSVSPWFHYFQNKAVNCSPGLLVD